MDNEVMTFVSTEFGTVRTIRENSKIMFCGKDVAAALGYRDTVNALKMHCKEDGVVIHHLIDSIERRQAAKFISEGNLYRLIAHSRLPSAERFERWIFDEVLPTIRRTGGYVSNDELFTETYLPFADDETKALFRLQLMTIRQLNARIEHDRALVEFAEHVADTGDVIDMNTMAKLAAQKNIHIGRTRMMRWMKMKKILLTNNLPYQKYIDKGYFVVKETTYKRGTKTFSYQQTFVTGKGQLFLINRLKAEYLEGV